MANHKSHLMRNNRRIMSCSFSVLHNLWALRVTDQLKHVSFTNVFCNGDLLKLSELVFLIESFKQLVMPLRKHRITTMSWPTGCPMPQPFLLLLQRTLKASGAAGMTPMRRRSSSATLFGRMISSFRGTPQGVNLSFVNGADGVDTLHQVEAKYPAFLFKQQLTAYVEKIYGMIRDNLKKEISPLLRLCIQWNKANGLTYTQE